MKQFKTDIETLEELIKEARDEIELTYNKSDWDNENIILNVSDGNYIELHIIDNFSENKIYIGSVLDRY